MTKVLVLGGDGMLGHKVFQHLRSAVPGTQCTIRGAVADARHRHIGLFQQGGIIEGIDALDLGVVDALLERVRPEVVVNCIGVIKQRPSAHEAIPSITINSLLPHRLAAAQEKRGARVIHFSTDCVFTGAKGHYREDDLPDAEDLYGRTKFLGEVGAPAGLTLRTSIIGRELSTFSSLLEWLLAQRGKRISGFTRAIYSGVTTNHLAQLVGRLVSDHRDLRGLYHVASDPISKYELLGLLRDAYGLDVEISPDPKLVCDRSLDGSRLLGAIGYRSPSWPALVNELAADATPYDSWRK